MNEDVGPAYWRRLWRWENVHPFAGSPKEKQLHENLDVTVSFVIN